MNNGYLALLKHPIRGSEALPNSRWSLLRQLPVDRSDIVRLVPNDFYHLDSEPDDLDGRQWSLPRIAAPQAWSIQHGQADGPIVAVLDTGLDVTHPDLRDNLWTNPGEVPGNGRDDDGNGVIDDVHGYDAVHQSGDVHDGGEHGTHVAGIVAARGNNGQGIAGLNWQGRLLGIKIFDDNGNTDVASIIRALAYAGQAGAALVNCSWGGAPYNQALYEAMRDCPALLVCSAGNSGGNSDLEPHYPSSFDLPNLIAVASTTRRDTLSSLSCYGHQTVDLGAPGEQILSTVPGGYKVKSGTSQAAPHVTGAAALLACEHPDWTPVQLKQRLLATTDPLPTLQDTTQSGGRLNAFRALSEEERP